MYMAARTAEKQLRRVTVHALSTASLFSELASAVIRCSETEGTKSYKCLLVHKVVSV